MNTYCMVVFMLLCVVSHQLVSMEKQKRTINTAGELKLLALEVSPENYQTTVQKYTVTPEVVASSINLLLRGQPVSDDASRHVATLYDLNEEGDNKQIVQIMEEYYAQEHGQIAVLDQVKINIYRHLQQKISQKEYDIRKLEEINEVTKPIVIGLGIGVVVIFSIFNIGVGIFA